MIINGLRYELVDEGKMDPKGIREGDIIIYRVTKQIEGSLDRHMGYRAFGLGLEIVTNGPGLCKARAKLNREKAFRDQYLKMKRGAMDRERLGLRRPRYQPESSRPRPW